MLRFERVFVVSSSIFESNGTMCDAPTVRDGHDTLACPDGFTFLHGGHYMLVCPGDSTCCFRGGRLITIVQSIDALKSTFPSRRGLSTPDFYFHESERFILTGFSSAEFVLGRQRWAGAFSGVPWLRDGIFGSNGTIHASAERPQSVLPKIDTQIPGTQFSIFTHGVLPDHPLPCLVER